MTTPAGWYDDGSGRQRWWDGEQWTEHFAPEAAAEPAAEVPADQHLSAVEATPAESHEPSLDDTWVRPSNETVITPESTPTTDTPETAQAEPAHTEPAYTEPAFDAAAPAAATPAADEAPTSAAPPVTPAYAAAPPSYAPPAPIYPGAPSSAQPGAAYGAPDVAYPGSAPYGSPAPEGPKKVSILGLIGLGLSVLGTILVFVPVVGLFGFILLAAGFIVSLISIFLKGKKWPGITGLILAVVGTILGVVMSFVYLFAFAQGVSEDIDSPSYSASPSPEESEGTDEGTSTGARPTSAEVATGLTLILAETGAGGYTEEQISCLADAFVASDLDDATLRTIADSNGTLTDSDAAYGIAEVLSDTDTVAACFTP